MTDKSFGPVWVVAELADCAVEGVSLQLIGKARELADELETKCEALLLGHNIGDAARDLIACGADRVFVARDPSLEMYQPELYRDILCALAQEHGPEIILIGSTFMGRELAPLAAASLKKPLAVGQRSAGGSRVTGFAHQCCLNGPSCDSAAA